MTETDESGFFFADRPPFSVGPAQGSEWGLPGGMGAGLLSGYFGVSNRRYPLQSVSALVDVVRLATRINSGSNATYCDEVLRRASL